MFLVLSDKTVRSCVFSSVPPTVKEVSKSFGERTEVKIFDNFYKTTGKIDLKMQKVEDHIKVLNHTQINVHKL